MLRTRLFYTCLALLCFTSICFGAEESTDAQSGSPALPASPAVPYGGNGRLPPFEQALVYVYQQHPQLESDREELKILDERVSQATAGYRPTVSINAGTGEQRESINGEDWRYGDASALTLTAIQPLLSFGTAAQRDAAKSRVEAGRAHLIATEQTVFLAAITAWLELCEKERIIEVLRDHAGRIKVYQDATDQRLKAGEGTTTDLAQTQSRAAETEARLAIAEADLQSARAAYMRDVGLAAPNRLEFPALPTGLPQSSAEAAELARQNPELAIASNSEDAAEHDIETASSATWPSIYLRGSMSDERSPSLGLQRQRDDSITLNVSLPLYQGGAEYSKIREAKIARARTREDSIIANRNAVQRAAQAYNSYQASRDVQRASERASEAGDRLLSGVEEEQKRGTRNLTDVLDAKNELLSTQITSVQAQKNVRLEAYRLLAATGRLTVENLRLPAPVYDPKEHYDRTAPRWYGTDPD